MMTVLVLLFGCFGHFLMAASALLLSPALDPSQPVFAVRHAECAVRMLRLKCEGLLLVSPAHVQMRFRVCDEPLRLLTVICSQTFNSRPPNPTGDHVDEVHKPQRENASERELFTLV